MGLKADNNCPAVARAALDELRLTGETLPHTRSRPTMVEDIFLVVVFRSKWKQEIVDLYVVPWETMCNIANCRQRHCQLVQTSRVKQGIARFPLEFEGSQSPSSPLVFEATLLPSSTLEKRRIGRRLCVDSWNCIRSSETAAIVNLSSSIADVA